MTSSTNSNASVTQHAHASFGPCPRCSGELLSARVSPYGLLGCLGCGGAFLDTRASRELADGGADVVREHLRRLGNVFRPPVTTSETSPGTCPICLTRLASTQIGDVPRPFVCKEHGAWFDRGEALGLATATHANSRTPGQGQTLPVMPPPPPFGSGPEPAPADGAPLLAAPGTRLAAAALDLLYPIVTIGGSWVAVWLAGSGPVTILWFLVFGAVLLSQIYWMAQGRSFGKRIMKIRVRKRDGSKGGVARLLLLRCLVGDALIPSLAVSAANIIGGAGVAVLASFDPSNPWPFLTALGLLGPIFAWSGNLLMFTRGRRALHDLVAGTIVVDENPFRIASGT